MLYFTSDPHGDFEYIARFATEHALGENDIIMILGDACFHRFGDIRDENTRRFATENIPSQLIVIRGNHDADPKKSGCLPSTRLGANVLVEPDYPNIAYALDGEAYSYDGKRILAIGGAYTIEPASHLAEGYPVFNDSQPGPEQWEEVEAKLDSIGWQADIVATHTCPERFMLASLLHPGYDQASIDHSFELWLDSVEKRLDYGTWLFGHFHKDVDVNASALCLRERIIALEELS